MTEFIELKKKVIQILLDKGLDEDTIEEMLKDEDIYYAINNHFSAEVVAWAVLY